jgi:hypothetical protein
MSGAEFPVIKAWPELGQKVHVINISAKTKQ